MNPDYKVAEREMLVINDAGARVERGMKDIEEFAERYEDSARYLFRDRVSGWPLAKVIKAGHLLCRPSWWTPIARLRWGRLLRFYRTATAEEIVAEYEKRRKA